MEQITTDWKPGDMAECIDGDWYQHNLGPKLGEKNMVTQVKLDTCDCCNKVTFFLGLIGYPDDIYDYGGFRKIILTDTGHDRKITAPTLKIPELV